MGPLESTTPAPLEKGPGRVFLAPAGTDPTDVAGWTEIGAGVGSFTFTDESPADEPWLIGPIDTSGITLEVKMSARDRKALWRLLTGWPKFGVRRGHRHRHIHRRVPRALR